MHQKKNSLNGKNSEFMERFQGRQSLMNKEGPVAIVKNADKPIVKRVEKIDINSNLLR